MILQTQLRWMNLVEHRTIAKLIELVVSIITGPAVNLIEHLAFKIANEVLANFEKIEGIEITIHKPEAPIDHSITDISFTLEMQR